MKKIIGWLVGVVVVGVAVAAAVGFGGDNGSTADVGPLPPASAQITRQNLVDAEAHSGELGYGAETTRSARLAGTVTALAGTGTTVNRGGALYQIDNQRVVLLYGALPAYRELGIGLTGADVEQFEKNLAALGYDGFTVDDEYTSATADAVRAWQDDRGLPETGRVGPGRIVYAAGAVRVNAHIVTVGDMVQPGKGVLTTTGTARAVTVRLPVDDQRLAKKGASVRLTVPGGERVGGKITSVATVIEAGSGTGAGAAAGSGSGAGGGSGGGSGGGEPTTKIEVTVSVDKPAAFAGYDQASVDVDFTAAQRQNVLTVPVAALLALAEGGYGVELVTGTSSNIVAVHTGLFADGRVEISGSGIAEGDTVGMPT